MAFGGQPGPIRAIGRESTDASRQAINRVLPAFETMTFGAGVKVVHLDPQLIEPLDRFPGAPGFLNRSALANAKTTIVYLAFSQADASTTRQFGGTGLGLAISRHLVELMGGQIHVSSVKGEGSCFRFDVPFEPAETAHAPAMTPRNSEIKRGARVLVAEDNGVNQWVIKSHLARLGAIVTMAENGVQAAAAATFARFDVIFMDCQMPLMDGFEATGRIRAWGVQTGQTSIPIIALTANALAGDREACLAAGMTGYLTRPVTAIDLARVRKQAVPEARSSAPGEGVWAEADPPADLSARAASRRQASALSREPRSAWISHRSGRPDQHSRDRRGNRLVCLLLEPDEPWRSIDLKAPPTAFGVQPKIDTSQPKPEGHGQRQTFAGDVRRQRDGPHSRAPVTGRCVAVIDGVRIDTGGEQVLTHDMHTVVDAGNILLKLGGAGAHVVQTRLVAWLQ